MRTRRRAADDPRGPGQLKAEIEYLQTVARAEMAERIKAARELGDLKENAEYHDAKDAQAILETKLLRLQRPADARRGRRGVRTRTRSASAPAMVLSDRESGRELRYTLVSAVDANAAEGKLSFESPVGQALVGAKAGDVVELRTPRGARTLEVVSISLAQPARLMPTSAS